MAALSDGSIDIDHGISNGSAPRMIAYSDKEYPQVVRILLSTGVNVPVVAEDGGAALHGAAQDGHLAS